MHTGRHNALVPDCGRGHDQLVSHVEVRFLHCLGPFLRSFLILSVMQNMPTYTLQRDICRVAYPQAKNGLVARSSRYSLWGSKFFELCLSALAISPPGLSSPYPVLSYEH